MNNLLLLNASTDFLFAARCGFPFPRVRELLIDGPNAGMLRLSDLACTRRIKRPLLRKKLHKPSVFLFQPIMQRSVDPSVGDFLGNFAAFDSFLAEHTLPPYLSGVGILLREYPDRVECIKDMEQEIAFDSITGHQCQPMYSLVAQVYELQNNIDQLYVPVASDFARMARHREHVKLFRGWNTRVSNYLRTQPAHA